MGCSHPSGNVPPQAGLRLGHRAATDRRQDRLAMALAGPYRPTNAREKKRKGRRDLLEFSRKDR